MWPIEAKQTQVAFLDSTWRKRASVFATSLDIDALAKLLTGSRLLALSAQEIVESRIINANANGGNDSSNPQFGMEFGPFTIDHVSADELLMIQSIEAHYSEATDFLARYFSFLPRWRIDDVMASYGHEGANCGAHFDHYDVFLVQIRGQKHWSLDDGGHTDRDLDETADVRLLNHFTPSWKTVQKPGDVLYIPPGIGHHGIASKDSLTLSIGIRNPTANEMISHLADSIGLDSTADITLDDELNSDPVDNKHGDFSADLIRRLQSQLSTILLDETLLSKWYGSYMTEPREPDIFMLSEDSSDAAITIGHEKRLSDIHHIDLHLATRLAHTILENDVSLFVNGEAYKASLDDLAWFNPLQKSRTVDIKEVQLTPPSRLIISSLLDSGAFIARNSTNE